MLPQPAPELPDNEKKRDVPLRHKGTFRPVDDLQGVDFRGHALDFVTKNVFFAEIWRHIYAVPTNEVPTAAVTFNEATGNYVLGWNPSCFKRLNKHQIQGVFQHEVLHIVWDHLTRLKKPFKLWNVAQDLAINSAIVLGENERSKNAVLPKWVYIPGRRPHVVDMKSRDEIVLDDTPENRELYPLVFFVETLVPGLTSHEYAALLQKSGIFDKKLSDEQIFTLNFGDVHDWEDLLDDPDRVSEITQRIITSAVNQADASRGWGNFPAYMQALLRSYINRTVDWGRVFEYFVGTARSVHHYSTMTKINKRYMFIHPGKRRTTQARVLVAVDASGSVNDGFFELLFAAMRGLNETVEFDIVQFDSELDKNSIKTWSVNDLAPTKRERCGGTNFDAPTQLVNDPENDGRWDALIICTDGEAPSPRACRIQRAWLLPEGCKLHFSSDELQLEVKKERAGL